MTTAPRTVTFVGKGGSGKSTACAYALGHTARRGIPTAAFDADTPGEGETGSLYALSDKWDLGAPVYRAPAPSRLKADIAHHTPPGGIAYVDSGAWERRTGNMHLAAMACADLVVFTMKIGLDLERAGSVLAARDTLEALGITPPPMLVLLTMVNQTSSAYEQARGELSAILPLMPASMPISNGRRGYAHCYEQGVHLIPGDALDCVTDHILKGIGR